MKYFTDEVINDYLDNMNCFDDIDKSHNFLNMVISYLDAVKYDRRFTSLYNELEKGENRETTIQFIEMTKRVSQLSKIITNALKKFDKEKNKIIRINRWEAMIHLPLSFLKRKLIRKTTTQFLRLQIYLIFYTKHFEKFQKSIIYKKSAFREWEDIDDNTALYDVLPLFDRRSERSAAFYGSVQFAIGWSFYCKMFRAKEFLNLYNLTVLDMKENDIYYISKALGVSLSNTGIDADLTGLLSKETRESDEKKGKIKTIPFTLAEQYEKETGLTPEMLAEQNLFDKNETQERINSLKKMIDEASENGNAVMIDLNSGDLPIRLTISYDDLPKEIREQIRRS